MIKDFLISFKDNFKEKTRNPFLGTYLVVWSIRNWKLVYTLFNFDKEHDLEYKTDFITSYYTQNDFLSNLLTNILWAFGVLILTYLLLNISRFIINISEKQITPWIYKVSDSKSIVLKETYDKLNSDKLNLEIKLEKERENKARLQSEILNLENKLEESYLNKNNEEVNLTTDSEKDSGKDNVEISKSSASILLDKLKKRKYTENFLNTELFLSRKEGWMQDSLTDEYVDYFTKIGLLNIQEARNGFTRYLITEEGNEVLKKIRLDLD
jgi:hypothetical protein